MVRWFHPKHTTAIKQTVGTIKAPLMPVRSDAYPINAVNAAPPMMAMTSNEEPSA